MIAQLKDVTLRFNEDAGVFDINLEIPESTIVGLLGPSGCGKSTLLKLMVGLLEPDEGEIEVLGNSPQDFSLKDRGQFAYVPQHFVLYPNLTVVENLRFVASIFGVGPFARRNPIAKALKVVELEDVRGRPARALSGGMQRRLQIAAGLLHDPQFILADEPTAGVDPVLRDSLWEHLFQLRDAGKTILLTSQYVDEAVNCDLVGIMNEGRLIEMGEPNAIQTGLGLNSLLDVTLNRDQAMQALDTLYALDWVQDAYRMPYDPSVVRVQVVDPARNTRQLLDTLKAQAIEVVAIEKVHTSFDDAFHTIVKESVRV